MSTPDLRSHPNARVRTRHRRAVLVLAPLLLLAGAQAFLGDALADDGGAQFVVVVHPSNPKRSVDRRLLAKMFLKDVSRWSNDEQIHPVDQRRDAAVRSRFSERILGRSVAAVRNYWQQRIFAGRGVPPPELESDEQVIQYVLGRPGAVGYVSARAELGKARALPIEDG